MTLEFHRYANLFPMMTDGEMDALRASMRENGYRNEFPIVTYEGQILDGRNRYTAALAEGIEPVFTEHNGNHVLQFVIDANKNRRHLTSWQLAFVALEVEKILAENARERQGRRNDLCNNSQNFVETFPQSDAGRSSEQAAAIVGTNAHYVTDAKKIVNTDPKLGDECRKGKVSYKDAKKKVSEKERKQERAALAETATKSMGKLWRVDQGDIRTYATQDKFDFIITDPPYPKEYLELYGTLAERAKEWLKPGGLLLAMCGQSYLDAIYSMLSEHLEYYWTACYFTPGQPTPLRTRQVNTTWKPILIFKRRGDDYKGKIFGDVFKSDGNDKDFHKWGQSISGMHSMISQVCLPGQTILDPFCGAGTTGIAAVKHGCFFNGVELDPENVNISRARLEEYDNAKER